MRIRAHQPDYRLRPTGHIESVVLKVGSHAWRRLQEISPSAYSARRLQEKSEEGEPIAFCWLKALTPQKLLLWPTPTKGGLLRIRYYPPMKEV